MTFHSIAFIVFLPIVFVLYWFVTNKNLTIQNLFIIAASFVFYGWWDYRFLSLIIFSATVDFIIGIAIGKETNENKRKLLITISCIVNLGFLGFFKYFNFFVDSFMDMFALAGIHLNPRSLNIILPIGISFYTFQSLSYTIDVYRNKLESTRNAINFFAFVSFFPPLVAGPIERAANLLPQFSKKRVFSYETFSEGFKLMIAGFFMKIVVADRAAIYVDSVYNNVNNHDGITFIAATVLFAFQLYADFAGYSLIAKGTAKLLGFNLSTNFRRPYFATSIGDFWQRWHISLSTWFRDYVFFPSSFSLSYKITKDKVLFIKKELLIYMAAIFITWFLTGLWHGANWTFLIWGGLFGFYLIFANQTKSFRKKFNKSIGLAKRPALMTLISILITNILVSFTWIFFRANSVGDAFQIVGKIFTKPGKLFIPSGADEIHPIYALIAISILLVVEIKQEYFNSAFSIRANKYQWVRVTYFAFIIFLILFIGVFGKSQFIYFQF